MLLPNNKRVATITPTHSPNLPLQRISCFKILLHHLIDKTKSKLKTYKNTNDDDDDK